MQPQNSQQKATEFTMPTKFFLSLTLSLLFAATIVSAEQKPEVAGVAPMYKGVVELKVALGQKVKKGQLLFELNQDILKAQKKFDEQNLHYTKRIIDAATKLIKDNSISLADYQESMKDHINATEALKLTEITMNYCKYYAPFDGTVTKIFRYTGSGLGDNDDCLEITRGNVQIDTTNPLAVVGSRYAGILNVKVALGQAVKKGDLLFTTNTAAFDAQRIQAENLLVYYEKIYERRKKLYKTKTVSLYLYLTGTNNYNRTQKNLEIAKRQIQQSSFHAPFDGVITKIYHYTGSGNGEGKPVLEMIGKKI